MRKVISILTFFTAICISARGPTLRISGVIRSSRDSSALDGASVLVKGTSAGTSSNATGTYTINCQPNATLIVTFLGYVSKEVPVNKEANANSAILKEIELIS